MSATQTEISALEESLRLAELGPDPQVFEDALNDAVVLVAQDGVRISKQHVVEAHGPGIKAA